MRYGTKVSKRQEDSSVGWFDNFRREKRSSTPIENVDAEKANSEEIISTEVVEDSSLVTDDVQEERDEESQLINEDIEEEDQTLEGAGLPIEESVIKEPQQLKTYKDKKPIQHAIGITKVIAIINQKGGVGKSTTAVNLSAALGEQGKQVLLIDLDPQGNATSGLGVEKKQVSQCIYDVLLNDVNIEDVIIPDVCEGLDLVPATINLAGAEVELVSEMARENRLKDAVGRMRGKYDYIFVDCPPSLGLLTVNALVGSDKLIIPIQTEFYALEGVTKLLESMKRVKNRLNPSLDIFGILLTMYDGRTTLSRQVAAEVRNYFGSLVFETIIPRTVKLSEAPSYGIPICQYDPLGKGAVSYNNLAKEVMQRG